MQSLLPRDTLSEHNCYDYFVVSVHDASRHMKNGWCPENREPLAKRMKTEDSSEPDIHSRNNIEANELFVVMVPNESNLTV